MTHCIECEGNSEVGHASTCYYAKSEVKTPFCPKCMQPMLDGEVVNMAWDGTAISHINCPTVQNPDYDKLTFADCMRIAYHRSI